MERTLQFDIRLITIRSTRTPPNSPMKFIISQVQRPSALLTRRAMNLADPPAKPERKFEYPCEILLLPPNDGGSRVPRQ